MGSVKLPLIAFSGGSQGLCSTCFLITGLLSERALVPTKWSLNNIKLRNWRYKAVFYMHSDIEEEISETVEAEMTQRSREGDVCMCWCVYKSTTCFSMKTLMWSQWSLLLFRHFRQVSKRVSLQKNYCGGVSTVIQYIPRCCIVTMNNVYCTWYCGYYKYIQIWYDNSPYLWKILKKCGLL